MEDGYCPIRRCEDLNIDVLVTIFQLLDIFQLTSGISDVCDVWHMACCDPLLWKTLDLSMLESYFIPSTAEPFVYVGEQSDATLTNLLEKSLGLSRGNVMTLIFHFNLYIRDDQLTYTAERCPRLRRLVLPAWNRIKKTGMTKAIRGWKDLESLTMRSIANPRYLLEEIAANCRNFSELKIMGRCDILFASSLAEFLPNLRVLSLRYSTLFEDALILILDRLQHLEVLNISHCELKEPQHGRSIGETAIRQKASRLREFFTCMQDSCIMCRRTREDKGLVRWYKYEEGLWKTDEIRSLSL